MELVYLWVEDYKNIKNQGFNFSPRFRCEFKAEYKKDEDGNKILDEEKSELIICDKKDPNCENIEECKNFYNEPYLENFFGENINITAIVGKNGSGKSSLLEIIEHIDNDFKVVIKVNNTLYTNFDVDEKTKEKYKIEWFCYLDEFNIYSSLLSCKQDSEPTNCEFLTIAEILEYDNTIFKILNKNFVFKYWQITINKFLPELKVGIKKLDDIFESNIYEPQNELSYLEIFTYVAIKLILYILANKPIKKTSYWSLLNNLANNFTKENYLNLVNSIDLERLNGIGNYNKILEALQNYDESLNYIESFLRKQEINSEDIKEFIASGVFKAFRVFSKNWFKYPIIDINYLTENNLSYLDLSDGQQRRMVNIAFIVNHLIKDEDDTNLYLPLLDEPDTYLHPNWQKSLINDLINILSKFHSKKIHFIFTTHSPFLLSDIPKQNIIFLDTDENGNCKVVDGLNEKKETFGANIHTLLSDSFFMEDGLMGEFAKSKINKIIRFLNEKNRFIDFPIEQIKQVIESIGEPFLKQKLLDMYYKKYSNEKELKIKELEEEIKRLKNG